jgi:hypothetical protein
MTTLSFVLAKNFLYDVGYYLGYGVGVVWPFLLVGLIFWIGYSFYRKKKNAKRN